MGKTIKNLLRLVVNIKGEYDKGHQIIVLLIGETLKNLIDYI